MPAYLRGYLRDNAILGGDEDEVGGIGDGLIIKNGLAAMAKAFGEKAAKGLVWFAEYTPNADHQSNAEISATMGIRRWSEFLKK